LAFTSTIQKRTYIGPYRLNYGTFTITGATTGGDVTTGLKRVLFFKIQENTTAIIANCAVINESLPLASGDVTIVTGNVIQTSYWFAVGL
jgi:hypothetical protein